MAKTRLTSSQRSVNKCFVGVREKACYESLVEKYDISDEGDRDSVELNINSPVSVVRKNDTQTSRNRKGINEELSDDTEQSENTKNLQDHNVEGKESQEETADDDKSDYDTESFFSDGSFKGSEVTNVTARSSMSGSSSLLHSIGLKYEKKRGSGIQSRMSGDRYRVHKGDGALSPSESEIKNLSEEGTLMLERRQLTHSGRRNMSFTNDELRRIERENQLLLKKIMSHQKLPGTTMRPINEPPRTSSSAINRKRQQKRIEEDNMLLLRRIQQAKSCAIPRTAVPGCRLTTM